MEDAIFLSIIVPVFNVEDYLTECIESIESQAINRVEIILVDDGSTDTSGQLCDGLKEKHQNIVVIHKDNGGLSSARNLGLSVASGKYVSFVDSDDKLSFGCINTILDWITNSDTDLCFMQAVKQYPDGNTEPLGDDVHWTGIHEKSKNEIFQYLSTRPKYGGSACTKIYRRLFLLENNLCFPSDRRQSEDLGFVRDCILNANTFDVLEKPFYIYRQNRPGSITRAPSINAVNGLLLFIKQTVETLPHENQRLDDRSKCLLSIAAYEFGVALLNYSLLSIEERKIFTEDISGYSKLLKYGTSRKTKALYIAIKFLGIDYTSKILKWYYKR